MCQFFEKCGYPASVIQAAQFSSLSLHQGNTDSRKNLEQRFIFQIGTVNPHGINERFLFN